MTEEDYARILSNMKQTTKNVETTIRLAQFGVVCLGGILVSMIAMVVWLLVR